MENQADAMEEAQAEDIARFMFTQALAWARGETGSWEYGGMDIDVERFAEAQVEALIYAHPHYAICVTENAAGLYYSRRHIDIMKIFNDPHVVEVCSENVEE